MSAGGGDGGTRGQGEGAREWAARSVPALRIPLSFSEQRVLLIVGDALLLNAAVLAALYLWARVGTPALTFDFVQARWFWFPLLTGTWWPLVALLDLYDVPVAGRRAGDACFFGFLGQGWYN